MDSSPTEKGSPEGGTIHFNTNESSGKKNFPNGSDLDLYQIHLAQRIETQATLKRSATEIIIGSPPGPGDFSPLKKARTEFVVENKMSEDLTVIHEEDTEPLRHQLAGHGRSGVGVLKHKKLGYILKPVQPHPFGTREKEFYRTVCGASKEAKPVTKDITLLRNLVPPFHGVAVLESVPEDCEDSESSHQGSEFIVMGDIIQNFRTPCILDLKIGRQTWDPDAPTEKIVHEKSKYAQTKETLGLSLTGMLSYDMKKGKSVRRDPSFGKQLDPNTLRDALGEFLNEKSGVHQFIAKTLVKKLLKVKEFFCAQKQYLFYSSSLLIAYDASYVERRLKNSLVKERKFYRTCHRDEEEWLRVWMIDFSHVHPADGQLDNNYIFGLNSVIRLVTSFAENNSTNSVKKHVS